MQEHHLLDQKLRRRLASIRPKSNGRPLFGGFANPSKNMVSGWIAYLIVVTLTQGDPV